MASAETRNIKVVITPNKATGVVGFEFDGSGVVAPNRIRFENDNHPGFIVYFKIKDIHRTGLRFRSPPHQAMWVSQGLGNPAAGAQWNGFVPLSVENDGKRLIVYCPNWDPDVHFKFTLRFETPGGGYAVDWDPIGDGVNGPRGAA